MTMREKIARAMYEKSMANMKNKFPVQYEESITDESWEGCDDWTRNSWCEIADSALDVLLDPTREMRDAMSELWELNHRPNPGLGNTIVPCDTSTWTFTAGIHAAKDGK